MSTALSWQVSQKVLKSFFLPNLLFFLSSHSSPANLNTCTLPLEAPCPLHFIQLLHLTDSMCTFFHVHGFIVALAVALLVTNAGLPYLLTLALIAPSLGLSCSFTRYTLLQRSPVVLSVMPGQSGCRGAYSIHNSR